MSKPDKPVSKKSNSRFTTRNNKQDIFSKFVKDSKTKSEIKIQTTDDRVEKPDNKQNI